MSKTLIMLSILRINPKRAFVLGILVACTCTIVMLSKEYEQVQKNIILRVESSGNALVGQLLSSSSNSRSHDHFASVSDTSHDHFASVSDTSHDHFASVSDTSHDHFASVSDTSHDHFASVSDTSHDHFASVSKTSHDADLTSDQKTRLHLIESVCSNGIQLRNAVPIRPGKKRLYFSSKYQVSYCKVPKVGSTYWTQVFQVLKQNTKRGGRIFTQARRSIHIGSNRLPRGSFEDKESPTIISTRNPYSRLYSAFIDKSYTMLAANLNKDIVNRIAPERRNSIHCYKDITFSDFLKFIVKSVKTRAVVNEHWAPVYSLCDPCNLNVSFVAKQESFSADVESALKKFKVDRDKFDLLMSALHEHRVEQSLPGIIKTAYINTGGIRRCMDANTLVHRLWESFQIQGYILNQALFPSQKFQNSKQFEDVKYVTQVIMDTIKKFPLSSKESQLQRQSALAHAYKKINQDVIKDIQKIYELDFEMFGYSLHSPNLPQEDYS